MELAVVAPFIMFVGLGAFEVANMATARMKVSQIALSLADNAARLGQTDNSGITPTISEADLDSVIDGALRAGSAIDLQQNGRIIISSVEFSEASNRQYIHWQRCRGSLARASSYGNDSNRNGLNSGPLPPLGNGAQKFQVAIGESLMFVEVYYRYDGLMGELFAGDDSIVGEQAGLLVRDDRNLVPGLTGGGSRSSCR